jgi:hypothetical protein
MSDGIAKETLRTYPPVVGGMYRHWKGGLYIVLGVGKDSANIDNRERKVFYMSLEDGTCYHRPVEDEEEGWLNPKVHDDGTKQEKFQFVGYSRLFTDSKGRYHVERVY